VFVDDRGVRANCWNCGHQVEKYCNEDEAEAKKKAKQDDQKTGTQRKARGLLRGARRGRAKEKRDDGSSGSRISTAALKFASC
jgi:hypothetical protein